MRVLGVDPGLTRCGLGVIEGAPGRALALRHVEVLTTSSAAPLPERLLAISAGIEDLIAATSPDIVVVERMFAQHNLNSVMGTAQASAVAVLAAARAGLPVAWHTPTEVKAAVTGTGRADKAQVAGMVVRILRLESTPKPVDATDALALAICHVWRGSASTRIAEAVAATAPSRIPRRAAPRATPATPVARPASPPGSLPWAGPASQSRPTVAAPRDPGVGVRIGGPR